MVSEGSNDPVARRYGVRYRRVDRGALTDALLSDRMSGVSASEIDEYLEKLDEPKRSTLRELRRTILEVVPDAEQCISYGLPAFKVDGKTIAGFAAFKNHLSYLPHSGSVFPELVDELSSYQKSSGALRFDIETPLPRELVEKLIAVRMRQATRPGPSGRERQLG